MVFKPVYLLILIVVILIDYFAGIRIEQSSHHKKKWLLTSLISNLLILFFFKYFNFFNESIHSIFGLNGDSRLFPLLEVALPVGLSFHTFQAMSYTIEVYRGKQPAERNLLHYSIYVLYFPQLVAGPIERPQNLLGQFRKKISFDWNNLREGMLLVALGLFKKVVIADRLALLVDPVYNNIESSNGLSVLFATIFFAFEIYCDFSGYSTMAIGLSKMMGIDLMQNFNFPYSASSLREFWSRWHISLSTWFRDYVYVPLGGNKTTSWKWARNILIVFLLSGLWHGANWTFVVWGAIHGVGLLIERMMVKKQSVTWKWPLRFIVFAFVCFAWIFFVSKNMHDAFTAIHHITHLSIQNKLPEIFHTGVLPISIFMAAALFFAEPIISSILKKQQIQLKFVLSIAIFFLAYILGEYSMKPFIYFQF
jgi:alginate O-acetyltransferase complex protein AlgI